MTRRPIRRGGMSLYNHLQKTMQQALKEGQREKAKTLRTIMARLKDRSIAKGEKLTEAEEVTVLKQAA
ncbi:MAG: GatB/YqeY domain-containing protein, partial [Fidelibacterota bacterium]